MSHQIIEPKFNGFLVNKIPDDPVDAGIIFHKMLAKSKQENDDSITGVLNGICERWSVTADHVKACIQAFVDAQDAWARERSRVDHYYDPQRWQDELP